MGIVVYHHFSYLVTWPLSAIVAGVDFVLIQIHHFICYHAEQKLVSIKTI